MLELIKKKQSQLAKILYFDSHKNKKMKHLLFVALILFSERIFSQTLSPEQDNAIKIEQAKLKEGKITYTEYQKRYDEIVAPKNQNIEPPSVIEPEKKQEANSEPVTPAAKIVQESPVQSAPSQNNSVNSSNNQSQTNNVYSSNSTSSKNYNYRPGDQLIRFANKRYIAMGLFAGGYIFTIAGAVSAAMGGSGVGAILLGVACSGTSLGLIISSVANIKKAGEYLNMQQDGTYR